MSKYEQSGFSRFIDLIKTKKKAGSGKIIVFAGAAISLRAPSRMPSADSLLCDTLDAILENHNLRRFLMHNNLKIRISATIIEAFKKRLLPPELFYDSIYEYVGRKVFDVFYCLKEGQPNDNHRILVRLLEEGYIDKIVTTNFDTLLEQSLGSGGSRDYGTFRDHIWKIHGDINAPDTMITTFRRVGQSLFDDYILKMLKGDLDGSHVLFIGYGGTDADLVPALLQSKMKSVFWVAYNKDEFLDKSKKEPWTTIKRNCGDISWIIGDLYESALAKIEEAVFPNWQKETDISGSNGIQRATRVDAFWLEFSENVSVLLQILYNTAGVSPSPECVWALVGELADELLDSLSPHAGGMTKLMRDLHSFRAEAHMQRGEIVEAKNHLIKVIPVRIDDWIQVMAILNAGVILTGLPGDKNAEGAEDMFLEAMRIIGRLPAGEPRRLSLQGRYHANLAVLRIRQGRPFEASKHFDTAAKLYKEAGNLLEYIGVSINQARHFICLGDMATVLKCYFKAEQELACFPKHQLSYRLRDLQQEISRTGVDIAMTRYQLRAGELESDN